MPTRKMASAPWAPLPARACTGRACTGRAYTGNARANTARSACSAQRLRLQGHLPRRAGVPTFRPDRRDRPDAVQRRPNPPAAPTARLDPFGSRRAPAAEELTLASAAK